MSIQPYLADPTLTIAVHYLDAEWRVLKHLGMPWPANWWDTCFAEAVLDIAIRGRLFKDRPVDPDSGPYSLLNCLQRRGLPVRSHVGKHRMQERIGSLSFAPSELPQIVKYCVQDCEDTLTLARLQMHELATLLAEFQDRFRDLLMPHRLRIAGIRDRGIRFDMESFVAMLGSFEKMVLQQREKVIEHGFLGRFGTDPYETLKSPRLNRATNRTLESLGIMRFVRDRLEPWGQDENDPDYLQRRKLRPLFDYADRFEDGEIPDDVLDEVFAGASRSLNPFLREAGKLHSLINLCKPNRKGFTLRNYIHADGRLRVDMAFPGTSSYRTQPGARHPLALPYMGRPIFVAGEGNVILEADYKCEEIGLAAWFFGDRKLTKVFNNFDKCLYCEIANRMGKYPSKNPKDNPTLRAAIKTAILAIMYGAGVDRIASNLFWSIEETDTFVNGFWGMFDDLHLARQRYLQNVRKLDVAENPVGLIRKHLLFMMTRDGPKPADLSLMNFPVQSHGSVILMRALEILGDDFPVIFTAHDAIVAEVPKDGVREAAQALTAAMTTAMQEYAPGLRCRLSLQAAQRYFKDSPTDLHDFCDGLGLMLSNRSGLTAVDVD